MKRIILLGLLGLIFSCQSSELELVDESQMQGIEILTVESPSVAKNRIEEPVDQLLSVYLPPSYHESEKSYPVVYYLHGYSGSPLDIRSFKLILDFYFEDNPEKEFILVGVDGATKIGGSFFANSQAMGNWADFLNIETIAFIESRYRVLSGRENRGIAGFSMGGSGAVNNGLANPELYGSMLATGAGLFDENGLALALEDWNEGFESAYGTAFSPIWDGKELAGYNTPVMDGSEEDQLIVEQWQQGYGALQEKIDGYLAKETSMNIFILCGEFDNYVWIREGSAYMDQLLTEAGIDHQYVVFDGGHGVNIILKDHFIPYFAENFAY